MQWCDIGVNFTDKRLILEPVLTRALEANVNQIIITGTSLENSKEVLSLAQIHPNNLFCTTGIHPHHASTFTAQTTTQLRNLAQSPQVVAIGECGLDFNRNFSTQEEQIHAFEQQLKLACELQLPVFLHEREAFHTQISLLKKYQKDLVGGVAHCFTGNRSQMLEYINLGFYIGITGWICDPKRGKDLQEASKDLPLERLLLETDAPYLRPKGLTNNRKLDKGNNEPAYLPYIAQFLANTMQLDVKTINHASLENTQALFGIPGMSN